MAKTPIRIVEIEFDSETVIFYEENSSIPVNAPSGYPVLKSISQAPATLIPVGGLGRIASLTLSLADFDYHNGTAKSGTFLGRLRAANKYYLDDIVNVYTGFLDDFDPVGADYGLNKQVYFMDRFDWPTSGGTVKIIARDISKKLDDKRAVIPKAVQCKLIGESEQHFYPLLDDANDNGYSAPFDGVETGTISYDAFYGAQATTAASFITVTGAVTPNRVSIGTRRDSGVPSAIQYLIGFDGLFGSIFIDSSARPQVVIDNIGTISTSTFTLSGPNYSASIYWEIADGLLTLTVNSNLVYSTASYVSTASTAFKFFRKYDNTGQADTVTYVKNARTIENRTAGISDTYTGVVSITNGDDLEPGPNFLLIEKEIVRYLAKDSDSFTIENINDRGVLGHGVNQAAVHANDKAINQVWSPLDATNIFSPSSPVKRNCVDLIEELLLEAGILIGNINTVKFLEQKTSWLSAENMTGAVSKPTAIKNIIKKISEQAFFDIWYDARTQLYELEASVPQVIGTLSTVTTDINILDSGHEIQHELKDQATQVWVFYDKIDVLGSDDPNNYEQTNIDVDLGAETSYGSSSKKIVYADFFDSDNLASVTQLASRYVSSLVDGVDTIKFLLDISDNSLNINSKFILRSENYIDSLGDIIPIICQMSKFDDTGDRTIKCEAIKLPWDASSKFSNWATDTAVDYDAATEIERIENTFWCDNSGQLPNGDEGYNWS